MTGIVGRADVGACLFFIASFLAYIKSHKSPTKVSLHKQGHTGWPWLLLCFVMCLASMLSKEQGITVLGTCVVYEVMILFSYNKKQTIFVILSKVSAWGVLIIIRVSRYKPSLSYNFNYYLFQLNTVYIYMYILCLRINTFVVYS